MKLAGAISRRELPPPVDLELDGQKVETREDYDAEELCAFECFLSGLSELGYGYAYRVLDAQYV
jgi:DNA (cytosine-5)-methyltransferase 1